MALSITAIAVPSVELSQDRSLRRVAATVGGAVLAAGIVWVLPAGAWVLTLGLIAAVVSVLVRVDVRRIAAVTVGVVLFGGGGTVSIDTAAARVVATAIGAAVVVTATLLIGWFAAADERAGVRASPQPRRAE